MIGGPNSHAATKALRGRFLAKKTVSSKFLLIQQMKVYPNVESLSIQIALFDD